ncbi:hypothetical protein CCR97_00945 [Rhodoplanes elegans]|uniref:UDP-glucose/GDP-mannose dehydrogenase C-terminal domain-containing protein n=1 Tax=Rhodoplanes elegans TaxID=29408 RepID=A0A327JXF8_9BRAD|nr:hypothetical protein [Rhodoplanes elegans]RAI27778.1 hypothetical protein CH338_29825 [Rhodoplanes elegans]
MIDYHDPFIAVVPNTREHAALAGRRSVSLTTEAIAGYDAVLIATDHDTVDYPALVAAARLVVDTRNVCGRARIESDKVVKT